MSLRTAYHICLCSLLMTKLMSNNGNTLYYHTPTPCYHVGVVCATDERYSLHACCIVNNYNMKQYWDKGEYTPPLATW